MQIYIADLSAYNEGYLKGEWIQLPTDEDEINDVLLRQSQNGKSDYAIHDWELPFKISEYTDPLKINEICTIIKELNINESLINHIEYAYGIDIKNNDALLRQSQNGKSDYAIHDWELPFKISEYTDPLKINEICTILKELDINESLINHIEYAYGIDIKNIDFQTLSNYIDDIYTIEASNDIEFAQNYMYEYYYNQIESLPWELSYSIDYETVYNKLQMTMSITQDQEKNIYYYSHH